MTISTCMAFAARGLGRNMTILLQPYQGEIYYIDYLNNVSMNRARIYGGMNNYFFLLFN